MRFRAPQTVRDAIQMFGLFESQKGINSILDRFDWNGVSIDHLRGVVVGRNVRSADLSRAGDNAEYVSSLLNTDEFRQSLVANFLNAFPEKPRILFVHIPKCAGTDLSRILSGRYLTINGTMGRVEQFSGDRIFEYLRELVVAAHFTDAIFVRGHVALKYYVQRDLVRPQDSIFTVVRDPVERLISAVNYRMTRVLQDPDGKRFDTKNWLERLGWRQRLTGADDPAAILLARKMLRDQKLVPDNAICSALGDGTVESALARIVKSDIEITDMTHYEAWLRERWNAPKSYRANPSYKVMTRSALDADDLAVLGQKTEGDRELYDRIVNKLAATASTSIRGSSLDA